MKLSTKEDIEAPLAFVYGVVSDFEFWERSAMRRGADVDRTDTLAAPGIGMGWLVNFQFHGKPRKVKVDLLDLQPDHKLEFALQGDPASGGLAIEMVEMGPKRTRVSISTEIKPKTLAARLFIQSLRLAKAKVNRKYELRVAQIAADIEDRYRAQIKG